jgi:predicted DNA-binding transcriptional regulator
MESLKDSFGKKLTNMLLKHRKKTQFEYWVPETYNTLLNIKNKEQRLYALLKMKEEAENEIREIALLSDFRQPIDNTFTGDKYDWINYIGSPVAPPDDLKKAEDIIAQINKLKKSLTPMYHEIENLQFHFSTLSKYTKKTIEEQFIDLFRDRSDARKVVALLKSKAFIDEDDAWLGKTDKKMELKAAYDILRSLELLKPGKITTQVRIFYKRFHYESTISERSFRNEISDPDINNDFNKLFATLRRR